MKWIMKILATYLYRSSIVMVNRHHLDQLEKDARLGQHACGLDAFGIERIERLYLKGY